MAELVDAPVSKTGGLWPVWVRFPPQLRWTVVAIVCFLCWQKEWSCKLGWFRRCGHEVRLPAGVVRLLLEMRELQLSNQDTVNEIQAQLSKASAEIVGKISDLEAAVAAGEVLDFSGLKAAAQALDDVVPDPVVEPGPEPGVE